MCLSSSAFFRDRAKKIKAERHQEAIDLLSSLNERNEFHLGYSEKKSQGKALGKKSASKIWKALSNSQAAVSALLKDIEDTCLLIHGIDRDILSDAVCNIIRGPLIKYTQETCAYYGIPMVPAVDSGPIWNSLEEKWEHRLIPLPMPSGSKLVLIPKIIVRHRLYYNAGEYYRHYLLPVMQEEELRANSALVEVLKDGRRRVTKKSLMEKYGADKLTIQRQTLKHPNILEEYRKSKRKQPLSPLTHNDFAEIESVDIPNLGSLLEDIVRITPGPEGAPAYEDAIERLLTALFYPSLSNPVKQQQIHEGRKRIDITYVNAAQRGFFGWLAQHYPAAHIFVECKNYGREVGNPEIDQLAGRFSPSRGQVGILVCRNIADKNLLMRRCRDTANDHRGFILPLDDSDLDMIIKEQQTSPNDQEFGYLRKIFNQLVM